MGTYTTQAELDALPLNTVVLDADRCAWQKTLDAEFGQVGWYPAAPILEVEDWILPGESAPFGHPQCAMTPPAVLLVEATS